MNEKALTVTQKNALDFREYMQRPGIMKQLGAALPKWLSPDRMLRVLMTEMMKNPKLFDCSKESVLSAVIQCAQLGLEPVLGRAYLVPYKNVCQFIPGYQGLIDLARRSGTISDVYAEIVYENDDFDLILGTERKIYHRPYFMLEEKEPGEIKGAYCIWVLKDGTQHPEYMPIDQVYKRRDASPSWKYSGSKSIWGQWPEEMIKKTVVKHSAKFVPASIEFMEAVSIDNDIETQHTAIQFNTSADVEVPKVEAPRDFDVKGAMKRFNTLSHSDPENILEACDKAEVAVPETDEEAAKVLQTYDNYRPQ